MSRVVVVGGGIVGTMHAWAARRRGHDVLQLEADAEPRRASVRNFGLVWVSGRAPGRELALARRARAHWEELGAAIDGIGFRPDGSLTVAQHPAELAVMAELVAQPDAADRGVELLDPDETRARNPALRGELLGALHCSQDAVVEPRQVLPALREHLAGADGYTFLPGRVATSVAPGRVDDHTGAAHEGDLVVVCPGAVHDGVVADQLADAPLRRCRLQMLQTEPLGERLTTALADGDSLRYYPAFDLPAAAALPPPSPVVAEYRAQLLVAQRASGELTIGDTHHYDEPYDFAVDETPYAHLLARAASLLGRPLPPVRRRWSGVYSQSTDERVCVRVRPDPRLVVVTGLGGRGMTLSPAVAEETLEDVGVITLAVLDMAGTTVSDGGVVEAAFVTALAGMGFDPDGTELATHLEFVRRTMGQSKIEVFTAVFEGDERRAHEANRRFEEAFDAAVSRGEVGALPGAEAALGALRAMGVRICLTTGFSRATREQIIDVLGWRDLVDLSLSPEPGLRGRPFPDLVLTALMRLDIDGVRSVAVAGDTTSDVISGHRAGARVVAGVLTGAHDRARLAEAAPTHVLGGIDELPGALSRLEPEE